MIQTGCLIVCMRGRKRVGTMICLCQAGCDVFSVVCLSFYQLFCLWAGLLQK